MYPGRLPIALILVVAAAVPVTTTAGELAVTPIRLDLTSRKPIGSLTIRNAGDDPTSLQLRVFAWSQHDGKDVLEPTQEVLANPGGFELKPGGSQLARFGLRTGVGAVEKSFRVVIRETPRADAAKPGQIATLLRISLPIFVEASAAAKPMVGWALHRQADGRLLLEARNTGTAHVQITRVTLMEPAGGKAMDQPVSLYVLPGARGQVELRSTLNLAVGAPVGLKVQTDGEDFSAALRVEGPDGERPAD